MKLRLKFFLVSALIAIIPMTVLTSVAYHQYVHVTEDRISAIVSEQFNNLVQATSSTFSSIQRAFHMMTFYEESGSSVVSSLKRVNQSDAPLTPYQQYQESNNVHHFCQNVSYSFEDIHAVYVFDASGTLFTHINTDYMGLQTSPDITNTMWYEETRALNGSIYITAQETDLLSNTSKDVLLFARSITDYITHELIGTIVFECSPSVFHLDQSNALGDSSFITLKNTSNQVILYTNYPNKNIPSYETLIPAPMVKQIPNTTLELSLIYDHNSLSQEYKIITIYFLAFAFLCILLTLILSYIFSHSLVRPIEALTNQMLHTNTVQVTPIISNYSNRPDEIGILYRQYSSMLDTLNTYIKEQYQNKLIVLDSQMKSLEARINSHFLFNTLEAINSMAEIDGHHEISTMSLSLGRMFRYAIKTESELVTLKQELNHVLDYVAIQSIRFNNRFHLSVHIPDSLFEKRILKLILQPLVENALIHGLNYCIYGDNICVDAISIEDNICITVSDNGQGMSTQKLSKLQESLKQESTFTELGRRDKQSIGLKNIQSRIELYYGKGYGLSITSQPEKGTSIQITIPNL